MTIRIFDVHPHIVSSDTQAYPPAPLGGKRSGWSADHAVDFKQLLAAMDAAGVEKAAIVHSSTTYGYDASYLADAIARHHDRFTGVFSIDVLAPDACDRLRYWLSRGLTGLRLFAAGTTVSGSQAWIADPATYAVWDLCQDLGITVAISMRQEALPHLADILTRFPRVQVLLDHLLHAPIDDGPPYAAADPLWRMGDFAGVHLKLTTANLRRMHQAPADPESFLARLTGVFGARRIAWGSNYPAVEGTLAEIAALARDTLSILPEEERENILWRTAARLYPALADAALAEVRS